MLNLFEIINKAYDFTKNHKFLWFFGLFLTSWGGLSLVRRIDFNDQKIISKSEQLVRFFEKHPVDLILIPLALILVLFIAFLLGSVARTLLIRVVANTEKKEIQTVKELLSANKKYFLRILSLSFIINAVMFLLAVVLLAPLYLIFSKGLSAQGVFLSLSAGGIYLPVAVMLSLVNVFSCCFIVFYDLSLSKAAKSAFDLISTHFEKIVALLFVLLVIYTLSFVFAFLFLGSIKGFTVFLIVHLKQLALSAFFVIIVAVFAFVAAVMLVINAALNVFTNTVWTLFFIKAVNSESAPKQAEPAAYTAMN